MEYSDTQVLLIQNFSNYKSLDVEMVKYQETNDVWGFSWNGRRKDEDFDSSFALNDKVKLTTKDTPFSTLLTSDLASEMLLDSTEEEFSDQNYNLKQAVVGPSKIIRFTIDRSQRMKSYIRYPAYTVV
jgi:hypothetical protein